MKNIIKTGVCLLVILLSMILPVTVTVIAQNGHGGSTQVIARIEQPSAGSSEETPPVQESSEISDQKPARTGDSAFPLILASAGMFCGAALVAVIPKNRKNR